MIHTKTVCEKATIRSRLGPATHNVNSVKLTNEYFFFMHGYRTIPNGPELGQFRTWKTIGCCHLCRRVAHDEHVCPDTCFTPHGVSHLCRFDNDDFVTETGNSYDRHKCRVPLLFVLFFALGRSKGTCRFAARTHKQETRHKAVQQLIRSTTISRYEETMTALSRHT